MTRVRWFVPAVAITIAIRISAPVASGPQQPNAQFRGRTDVVSVAVSVTRGRTPVVDLTASDFELTDNGLSQTVDVDRVQDIPIDLTFLFAEFPFDRGPEFRRVVESAGAIRAQLKPEDRLRIVTADSLDVGGLFLPREGSVAAAPGVMGLQWGMSDALKSSHGLGVALADALFYALALPTPAGRRHVVIAFTDGHSTASVLEMDRLPALASRSDAVLHAVVWARPEDGGNSGGINIHPPPGPNRSDWRASFQKLDETVQRTGGTLQRLRNADEALNEILTNFRSSYVLRYTPAEAPKPGWHEIKVRVTRPGSHNIRARRGYEVGR